jgi:hypothetical protein
MIPEIRDSVRKGAKELLLSEGLTWDSIHKIDIDTIELPVSARTLYRICKPNSEHTTTKKNLHKILKYLNISYTENYGIFQLIKIPENETSE